MKKPLTLLTFLLAASASLSAAAKSDRPNIVFILADDIGIPGIGCYGGDFKTPNIDALAAGGIRFDHCFAAPLCAPSRAMCMTGRYAFRTGVINNGTGAKASPQREVCIARMLKQAGYATAVAGKWRQLSYFTSREDGLAWGFDEFLIWGVDNAGEKDNRYWNPVYNHNGQPLADTNGKYGPDLLHEFVVGFTRRHRDQPFFVYYPMPLIHRPIERTPDSPPGRAGDKALYPDTIVYLDKLVGKLVAELDTLRLREKTLIVFAGDNGSVGQGVVHGRVIDGHKGLLNEGGSRVPLIANWKGVTPRGKVLSDLVDFTDFFPTFVEVAGAKLPGGVTRDGHSFEPQLRGEKGNPRSWVYLQLGKDWYVRDAAWKLTRAGELFDMTDAPFKQKPIFADAVDASAKAARQRLQAALDQLNPDAGQSQSLQDKPARKAARQVRRQNASTASQ